MTTVVDALFTAKEEISGALQKAKQATESYDDTIQGLEQEFVKAREAGNLLGDSYDKLTRKSGAVKQATDRFESAVEAANTALEMYAAGGLTASEANDAIRKSTMQAAQASRTADEAFDDLTSELNQINAAGQITTKEFKNLRRQLMATGSISSYTDKSIQSLIGSMAETNISTRGARDALDKFNTGAAEVSFQSLVASGALSALSKGASSAEDEIEEAGDAASGTAAQLSALSAIASTSAFTFGSLSVNIGPFNLALRNILTQLPAILAGMSSLIAIVGALAGAFLVLGGALGAIVAGGALAFFEDFSSQFEDSAEAVEALMGALQDLFTDAMEPLMTDANMDLFIDAINGAARVINRFAQFAAQMRDDVLALVNDIDADLEGMFEAMHDTFVILMPVLEGLIEFVINEFPDIMVMFAQFTDEVGGDINKIITSVGNLIGVLMNFMEVVLPVLAEAIMLVVTALSLLFGAFNLLPDSVQMGIIALTLISFAALSLITTLASLASWIGSVTTAMTAHAAAGTFLGSVYTRLTGIMVSYNAGLINLRQASMLAASAIWNETMSVLANAKAKAMNNTLTTFLINATKNLAAALKLSTIWMYVQNAAIWALTAAKSALSGAILGLITFFFGEAAAASVASAALGVYATVASIAATATSILAAAVGALSLPVLAVVAAIVILIGAILWLVEIFTGIDIFGGLIDQIKAAIGWVMDLVGWMDIIPGVNIGGDNKKGVANTDDIQTEPNVNLNFEDKLEQNMDINADPEDQEGLRRTVKDAMNEANSLQRRREGHTG